MRDPVRLTGPVVPRGDQPVELAPQDRQLLVRRDLGDRVGLGTGGLLLDGALGLPRVQQLAPGRVRAARGCRGSPAPPRCPGAPACRTRRRRTAPGRRRASDSSASKDSCSCSPVSSSSLALRLAPSPSRIRRRGRPRAASSACRGRGRARPPSRWRSRGGRGSSAGRRRRSRRAARERTKRPTACAKNSGVEMVVAYTPTASRGTSTPSDTMRTATIQRSSLSLNVVDLSSTRRCRRRGRRSPWSPVISRISLAYARAESWSEAMTRPPASGSACGPRSAAGRRRAARSASTSPRGSSAVRQACACASLVIGSPSRAAISSPALVRQRMLPL